MPLTYRHADECHLDQLFRLVERASVEKMTKEREMVQGIRRISISWSAVPYRILIELPPFLMHLSKNHIAPSLPFPIGRALDHSVSGLRYHNLISSATAMSYPGRTFSEPLSGCYTVGPSTTHSFTYELDHVPFRLYAVWAAIPPK